MVTNASGWSLSPSMSAVVPARAAPTTRKLGTGTATLRSRGRDRGRTLQGDRQGGAQQGARRVDGVGEVHDLDPDRCEVTLQLVALGGAAPVVALEDAVELQLLPGV